MLLAAVGLADVKELVVTLAAVIGGAWVLLRLFKERTDEAALDIVVTVTSRPYDTTTWLAFFDVVLTNKGKTKVQAKASVPGQIAFDDQVERLNTSCTLQVKRVRPGLGAPQQWIDWFDSPLLEHMADVNLLSEYEDPQNRNRVDFWMEPGEAYHLGTPLILTEGLYLGKITFIGSRGNDNFWSRIFQFDVRNQPATTIANSAG